ncbi:MAG: hypothetical protein ACYDD1_18765 [Caulobacteraceae bacterium]
MSANEQFYDDEIAPALLDLARKCEARGMGLFASVEYNEGDFGSTINKPAQKSDTLLMAYLAARAHGNIDALAISWGRLCKERGHACIVLLAAGFPREPSPATAEA